MYGGISEIYWDLLWKAEILKSVVGFGLLQPGWFKVNKQLWTSLRIFTILALSAVTHPTLTPPPETVSSIQSMATIWSSPQIHSSAEAIGLEQFCNHKAVRDSCISICQWQWPKQKQRHRHFIKATKNSALLNLFWKGRIFPAAWQLGNISRR